MFRKKDIILILVLAAIAGGLWLLAPILSVKPPPEATLFLRYSINGQKMETIPLGETPELTIDQGGGAVNILSLTANGFRMAYSTCHNQLCVYQGEVTPENMEERPLYHMIVCAPHRLVVELITATPPGREAHEEQ